MSLTRQITVTLTQVAAQSLRGTQLCIGQKVKGADGTSQMNTIWKSQHLSPRMPFRWEAKHALSYADTLPATGSPVVRKSEWQPCDFGQAYEIDQDGFWKQSGGGADPSFFSVSRNRYSAAVHIVVGLFDPENAEYLPLFTDPRQLFINSAAKYKPEGMAQLWYTYDVQPSNPFSTFRTMVGEVDTTSKNPQTNEYAWKGSYSSDTGLWDGDIKGVD